MSDLRFTKEGVPIFDGTSEHYIPYRRAALNYVETLEWKKRSLAGPRLQAALEGTARVAVQDQVPGWISHEMGAQQLLDYLKTKVTPPTLAEAGKMITRFFYSIKRRRGESMNHWILRHDEALFEARRTLAEAIQEYGALGTSTRTRSSSTKSQCGAEGDPGAESQQSSPPGDGDGPFNSKGLLCEDDDVELGESASAAHDSWQGYHRDQGWWWSDYHGSWDSWSWRGWHQPKPSQPTSSTQGKYDVSVTASVEADKFLPDFVVAWMLLQRSGLDGTERGTIIANLKNQFTTTRVKDALRLAWPEEDLKKRDMARGAALMVEDEDDEALMNDMDTDPPNDMTQEEEYEYGYLVKDAEEAYQTFQVARRTLREAREKQSLFKKSRQFFPMKRNFGNDRSKGDSKGSIKKCFRCNGDHPTSECPDKHAPDRGSQSAHLAFSAYGTSEPRATDVSLHAMKNTEDQAALSLQQILREGKAIIDGGATSSVASVEAMEQIMRLNQDQDPSRDIAVERTERPHFRFGNNGRTQCLSTAKVPVPLGNTLGEMRVHVHEIEGQPVLMSVAALRALGAVIDFEKDEAIFRNVDASVVVPLERAPSGHQLFPLTKDILSVGTPRFSPFSSLHESCKE